jgi:hypothetical protein
MTTKEMGDMLNEIGQHVADALGKVPDDVFVFIDAGDQWCGGAIFENLNDKVVYHDFSNEMGEVIIRLWEAADPDKKWSILLFDIKDGKFDAEFLYTADLKQHPFEYDYRQDALDARYGDKPIIYPPMDDGDWHELTEEDFPDDENEPI